MRLSLIPLDRVRHPDEARTLGVLEAVPGAAGLVEDLFRLGVEPAEEILNLGSRTRVGNGQFPALARAWDAVRREAGVAKELPLFVANQREVNAWTSGVERPFVVVTTGALEVLDAQELRFVLLHELGHVRLEHLLWGSVGRSLPLLVGGLPGGAALASLLQLSLADYERKCELSADRFGLLGVRDADVAVGAMVKLSGAPLDEAVSAEAFLAQYKDFMGLEQGLVRRLFKWGLTAQLSHPWTVERAALAYQWFQDEGAALCTTGEAAAKGRPGLSARSLPFECSACGVRSSANATVCSCGRPLVEEDRLHPCPACGVLSTRAHRFCEACGSRLHVPDENPTDPRRSR
ncbi:MAG: M48 family metallopeptidase [Deltaproteobacteria bacterium]|nr:M48 family metallopeptidase [Deltaproteobacteria bacterium]